MLELTGRVSELEMTVLELKEGAGPVGYPGTLVEPVARVELEPMGREVEPVGTDTELGPEGIEAE